MVNGEEIALRKVYCADVSPSCYANSLVPCEPPSSADKPGDFVEDCLSVLCEFRRRRACRAAQGTPDHGKSGAANLGGLLFGYFLFGRARESDQLPGCPRPEEKALKDIFHLMRDEG